MFRLRGAGHAFFASHDRTGTYREHAETSWDRTVEFTEGAT